MLIKVIYRSVDGVSKVNTFKTKEGAAKKIRYWLGDNPELGCGYAVSSDGVGTCRVTGAKLEDILA